MCSTGLRCLRLVQEGLQHGIGVIRNPYLAPLYLQYPFRAYQKRTAFDAHYLATVHVFFAYDVKLPAQGFIFVRQQVERKFMLVSEILVGSGGISRHAKNVCTGPGELRVKIPEILTFTGTARGVVFGVKINDEAFAPEVVQ